MQDEVPPRGGVMELRWNGGAVQSFALSPATRSVSLEQESAPGLHLLELESVAGGKVVPGSVELVY